MGICWKHFFIVRTVVQGQDLLRGWIRELWDTFQLKLPYVTIILCNITAWFKNRRKSERLLQLMVGFYFSQHCRGRYLEKCALQLPVLSASLLWEGELGHLQLAGDRPCHKGCGCWGTLLVHKLHLLFCITQRDGDILAKEEDWSGLMLNSVWDFGFSFEKPLHSMQLEQKPVREMENFCKNINL